VLVASSGAEALEISGATSDRIALLLTDVVMANMSGRHPPDILSEARPDIRLIYLSGYTEKGVVSMGDMI